MIRYHILAAFAGCALDALFGDPRNIPHPVCGIGNLIAWMEARLRKWFPANEKSERRAGTVLVVAVLLITGLARCSFWLPRTRFIHWREWRWKA